MCTVSRFLFRGRQNVRAQRANVRTRRPVFPPRCPPGRFSAGSRGKSCRKRLPSQGSWREAPERLIPRRSGKGSPSRGAGSAQPRLRGCREFATADASGGPIFSVLPEKIGEKRALGRVWCFLPLNSGGNLSFKRRSTRWSPHVCLATRRLIRYNRFVGGCG